MFQPAHESVIRFNLQHIYRLFTTPSKLPIQKLEALLVLLYARLPSQTSDYKIDEGMMSRVVAARGMLDSWISKLQMNIRHLEGYKNYLIEGERAGLWDKEISQLAEKLLLDEREILHQVASITRIVSRYLIIFNGRNDLMMADNELISHQLRIDQSMGLAKERWQIPEMAGAMNIKFPPMVLSAIQTPVIVPYTDAAYEELITARMEFVNGTVTQRAGLHENMALAQHKFQSSNISVLPHKQTKCERPHYLIWTYMSEDKTRKTLDTDCLEEIRTVMISERMAEHPANLLWKKHNAELGNTSPWNPQVIQPPRPNGLMVDKPTGPQEETAKQTPNPI